MLLATQEKIATTEFIIFEIALVYDILKWVILSSLGVANEGHKSSLWLGE